jgi:hypothetical protein
MKRILIFLGGFLTGILATIFVGYLLVVGKTTTEDRPDDNGLIGLTIFPDKGDCITTASKMESTDIEIFQVIKPNIALGNIENFTYSGKIRYYDLGEEVTVLIINYVGKTFYDDQKIEVTDKCVRQIGTYQYTNTIGVEKTVPAVVIE